MSEQTKVPTWGLCMWCGRDIPNEVGYHHNKGEFYVCRSCYNASNGKIHA